jgi:hypothetical protein
VPHTPLCAIPPSRRPYLIPPLDHSLPSLHYFSCAQPYPTPARPAICCLILLKTLSASFAALEISSLLSTATIRLREAARWTRHEAPPETPGNQQYPSGQNSRSPYHDPFVHSVRFAHCQSHSRLQFGISILIAGSPLANYSITSRAVLSAPRSRPRNVSQFRSSQLLSLDYMRRSNPKCEHTSIWRVQQANL